MRSDDHASVPTGALFIAADEPLLVFSSVAAAESWLEAVDVEDGVYRGAYGPAGEPFSLRSTGGRVIIEPLGGPDRPDELKALLLRYLEVSGRQVKMPAELPDLVAAAWAEAIRR